MRKISTILCFALATIFLCPIVLIDSVKARDKFVKWVDFNASYEVLDLLYKLDVESWYETVGSKDVGVGAVGNGGVEVGAVGSKDVGVGAVGSKDVGARADRELGTNNNRSFGSKEVGAKADRERGTINNGNIGSGEVGVGADRERGTINNGNICSGAVGSKEVGVGERKRVRLNFVEMLSYVAYKNGNNFSYKNDVKIVNKLVGQLEQGYSIDELTKGNEYFQYFMTAYGAIFKEFFGVRENAHGGKDYGLIAYSPIAKGFWYNDYDDFGNSRSFGFKRKHLGHDMMGSVGTPIVAVEGGQVAELGWNMYGGWRVGIRSHDGSRYYYYAHLRKGKPFATDLKKGDTVVAGQLIGYLGVTGYSNIENSNMRTRPHLHFGIQLIFDESQVSGNSEIWIDVYAIVRLLAKNKALCSS